LFLSQGGKPLSPDYTGHRLRRHLDAAGIARRGACHLFRHATATTMLDNGADIRCVQEMLGHVRWPRLLHVAAAVQLRGSRTPGL
jgi:integrase/recombinase XerD